MIKTGGKRSLRVALSSLAACALVACSSDAALRAAMPSMDGVAQYHFDAYLAYVAQQSVTRLAGAPPIPQTSGGEATGGEAAASAPLPVCAFRP